MGERGNARGRPPGRLRLHLVLVLVAGGLLALIAAPVRPVRAAGFVVTSAADATDGTADDANPGDGTCATTGATCTLRAAIQEANALDGADTITLGATTHTLAGALPNITGPTTLSGVAGGTIIEAGAATYPVLAVTDGDGGTRNAVGLTGLILRNGGGVNGGGINNAEGLTLTDTVVRDNQASSNGGGIYNTGDLALIASTVRDNRANGFGGGIYTITGTLTLTGSTVTLNTAGTPGNGYGGGIAIDGTTTITNSTIGDNRASCRGAGLHIQAPTTITGSAISGNQATGACSGVTPNEGGGIFKNGGTLALTDSTVTNNAAANGAGLYTINRMYIRGSTISGNQASGYGGGLAVRSPAYDPALRYYTTISNSTISGNTAGGDGGGLYNTGFTFLVDTTLAENSTGIATNDNFVALQGTLLANVGANCAVLAADTLFSEGHNLSDDATCDAPLTATGDLRNVAAQLEPLQANAPGATPTHALGLTSPARDAGSCTLDIALAGYTYPGATETIDPGVDLAADQRGVARPQRLTCDIGAFEPLNSAPLAGDDSYDTPQGTTLTVAAPGVLGDDGDADGDPLTAAIVTGPAHGGVTLNADGSFTYVPTAGYGGPDSFTYRASDGALSSNIATVSITVAGAQGSPTANPDSYSTPKGTPLSVAAPGVLANDSDPNNDPLTAQVATEPAHGTLALDASGAFVYTPAANYTGPDSFTYRASDGATTSAATTVSILVTDPTTPADGAPVAGAEGYVVTAGTALSIPPPGVLANDSDPEGGALTAVLATPPAHGSLTLGPDGGFSYSPDAGYTGPDSFAYRAVDPDGSASAPATVGLLVVAPGGPPAGQTRTVSAAATAGGTVSPAGMATYTAGGVASYAAVANTGQVFLGWMLDGTYVGYANPLAFTVDRDRTLLARFAARPTFADVPSSDADHEAITFLAALGVINPQGVNGSGQFQPDRAVVRAEMAAFIARLFAWDGEFHRNTFPDKCDPQGQACVDDELWNNVAALADYGVVGGYTDPATCASAGTIAPCYLPRDPVKRVQVLSIIARAFIKAPDLRATGFWDRLTADPAQYTNVPGSGSQRSDLTTYRANAGPIPGQAADGTFPDPEGSGTRRFVIQALYRAFASWYGTDRVP